MNNPSNVDKSQDGCPTPQLALLRRLHTTHAVSLSVAAFQHAQGAWLKTWDTRFDKDYAAWVVASPSSPQPIDSGN
ncbi:MAG: hypothetical protein EOO27_11520 [Comamonadaceae bacterium]|nr:MAG: hypothetical protein EOO27_11520 [Comamonadaceae bacterium]